MEGFLITHKGMEDIAALEVNEIIGGKSKADDSCVVFGIKSCEDLFKLCYKSQSVIGVYYLLSEFGFNDTTGDFEKNLEKEAEKISFAGWLNKGTGFRVKCIKTHGSALQAQEIEEKVGGIIIGHIQKKCGYRQKVDLDNPEIIIAVYLTEKKCYVGVEFAGFDLSKRLYNILQHPAAVKGTIAYALIRLAGYNKSETLLDPFSGSGMIPIESALFASSFPINFFSKEKFLFLKFEKFGDFDFNGLFKKLDKGAPDARLKIYSLNSSMRYVSYAKKNSKIAGIGKKINFGRMDIEWLDTKFRKGEVGKIVSQMPSLRNKEIGSLYDRFFYQAEFILNKEGKIVLIGDKGLVEKYSSKHKFAVSSQRSIFSGKHSHEVFVLEKK